MRVGTSPPNRSTTAVAMPTRLRVLARKKPVGRMSSSTSSTGAAASEAASGNRANSAGVVLLTRSSVHWADRMVAARSWNASRWSRAHSSAAVPGYRSPSRSFTTRARPAGVRGRAMGGGYR